ncbi:MAG: T9SS type A sorting domain-containing protein [Flavobacteriaceae bacterium]|nr:T9SS type A sorting domain-containing protein [Flavobacteriaceae bacterium]
MKHIFYVFFCLIVGTVTGQEYQQRSTLGMAGSSTSVVVGDVVYYVSASVGQRSVIGTLSNEQYTVRQGFQQPPIRVMAIPEIATSLNTSIYPNPVSNLVTVRFGDIIDSDILSILYDIQGREVLTTVTAPTQSFQLDMSQFASGTYILKIRVESDIFSTRLIKN